MLSSSDIYVLAGRLADADKKPTLRELARELHVDHTLVHRALKRAEEAGLYRSASKQVNRANFEELMTHAARFIAPAALGGLTRGRAAAWAAKPIAERIRQQGDEPPPVWPDVDGAVRGQALRPLHPAAVRASQESPALSDLLAIIDSLRAGDVRVRQVAAEELHAALSHKSSAGQA
jgi:DNA-binding transcriptional regulator YhcF (GntR family)